jgi:ATP-binding cassette subfamily B protein
MKNASSYYRKLLVTYLAPLKYQVFLLALCLFGTIGMQLWQPQILRNFIDLARSSGQQGQGVHVDLLRLAIVFLVLTLLSRLLHIGSVYLTQNLRWRATNRPRIRTHASPTYCAPEWRNSWHDSQKNP